MGKLMVHQFVSLDGYAADADGDFSLFENGEARTPEFDLELLVRLQLVDAILLGATTYRMFAGYWPTPASADQLVAPAINTIEKVVFSQTLEEAPWGPYAPARIESGDAVDAVRQLKEDRFGDLIVWGSLSLTDALFDAGLVDSVRIAVLPVILGSGRSAFPNGFSQREVRLIATNTFDDSIVATEYSIGSHLPTVTGAIAAAAEVPDVAPEPEPEPLPERLFESDTAGEANELPLPEAEAPAEPAPGFHERPADWPGADLSTDEPAEQPAPGYGTDQQPQFEQAAPEQWNPAPPESGLPAEENQAEDNQAEDNQAQDNQAEENQAQDRSAEDRPAESNPAQDNPAGAYAAGDTSASPEQVPDAAQGPSFDEIAFDQGRETPAPDDAASAENPPLDPEEAERLVSRRKWD